MDNHDWTLKILRASSQKHRNCCCCCNVSNYVLTYDLYIVLNYIRRADWKRMMKLIDANRSSWTSSTGEIDVIKYSKFYLANFDTFMNEKLYHRIVLEARDLYDFDKRKPLPILMNDEIRKTYYDYEKKSGGINFCDLDSHQIAWEFKNLYQKVNTSFYLSFSTDEREHLDRVYHNVLLNDSLKSQIEFVENTIFDNHFSPRYQSILLSYVNELKFLNSGDLYVPPTTVQAAAGTWDTWDFSNGSTVSGRTLAGTVARINGEYGVLRQ